MASRATCVYNVASYARRDANPNYLPRAKALGNYDGGESLLLLGSAGAAVLLEDAEG